VNRVAEEVVGSIAIPQSVEGPKRENDGFVRIPKVDPCVKTEMIAI
jgi:hypothetical protein